MLPYEVRPYMYMYRGTCSKQVRHPFDSFEYLVPGYPGYLHVLFLPVLNLVGTVRVRIQIIRYLPFFFKNPVFLKKYPFLLETHLMKLVDLAEMYKFHQVCLE
eukprot:SAG11_NODE_1431_length_4937_cov_1.954940_9_plen_103_part_00